VRFTILTAIKDLKRSLRDPMGLLTWIAMPLVITGLVALISTGDEPMPQGKLLVVDYDKSFVSNMVPMAFGQDPLSKMVQVEHVEMEAGRKQIDAGEASALLEIPKGFGDAALNRKPSRLLLTVNPSQRIVPKIIEEVLSAGIDANFYLQASLGSLPKLNFNTSDADLLRSSVMISQLSRQVAIYVDPRLVTLETTTTGERRKPISLPKLFFPGMLMMAIFGLSQALSQDWWTERQGGTLRRLIATPRPLAAFLAGKIAALWLICLVVAVFGLAIAKWAIGAQAESFVVAVLWMASSGVALYMLNLVLQMLAPDQRSGVVINQLLFFVLSMIGGSFFPFEMMPRWMANIGRVTPNGFAMARFKELLEGSLAPADMGISFACLAAFVAVGFLLLAGRLRKWAL
jgi:ABC-type multidrug transport system permease subunit